MLTVLTAYPMYGSADWLEQLRLLVVGGFAATVVLLLVLNWDWFGKDRRPAAKPSWNGDEYCPLGRTQRVECPHCKAKDEE